MPEPIRVWDLPTRAFHGLLALGAAGLAATGLVGGNAMVWHFRLGYAVLALLLFRLLWGVVGGRWSRFASFLYGARSVVMHLRGRSPLEHSVGHSPLGAASVFAMLLVLLGQAGSGLLSDDEIAFAGPLTRFVSGSVVSAFTSYHKSVGKWLLLALVVLHLVAIAFYAWRKKGLVGAMLHGNKRLAAPQGLSSRDDAASRACALVLLGVCVAAVMWVASLSA